MPALSSSQRPGDLSPARFDQDSTMLGMTPARAIGALSRPSQQFVRSRIIFPRARSIYMGEVSDQDLLLITRYPMATKMEVPPGGWGMPVNLLPQPSGPIYKEAVPPSNEFNAYFGLVAAPEPTGREGDAEPLDLTAALARSAEDQVRGMETEAFQKFRDATTPNAPNQYENLAEAMDLLLGVMNLDDHAYVPGLLGFHAGLERSHYESGLNTLLVAVRRHPAVFVERPELGQYFSEPRLLDDQMRRTLRELDAQADLPIGLQFVRAYCAWWLRDQPRLRLALAAIESGMSDPSLTRDERLDAQALRSALGATLNTR